ncbi:uncharacterized protein EV422DRAFT_566551 [Fimicolochytrium jonesii]|uniref:uncharacterized protein n=1 Tax=Fimicolochytrium jonesii TaxID=1396493 RepID=UPI0022FF18D7|nr:uncharacterized protein EV422DRAFT_566551 [Fimicolochytrium jonesii]KAI8822116.1 hypothetical protein EV422DRAFT_566551 [Fimicolochytrium jonesii]
MAWYTYIGALLASNLMRPGKHGLSRECMQNYAIHGAPGYVMYMYLKFVIGQETIPHYLSGFFTTVFMWVVFSYGFGLYNMWRGMTGKDIEPTTRAWEMGPHLTPPQRATREVLSIFAGCSWALLEESGLIIAAAVALLALIGYGFYVVEWDKEADWVKTMTKYAEEKKKEGVAGAEQKPEAKVESRMANGKLPAEKKKSK